MAKHALYCVSLDDATIQALANAVVTALTGVSPMPSLTDIRTKLTQIQADVTAQKDVEQAAMTLIQGLAAQVAALRQQLADAIAGGSDPAAIQAALDAMGSLELAITTNTTTLASAVVANTPSA